MLVIWLFLSLLCRPKGILLSGRHCIYLFIFLNTKLQKIVSKNSTFKVNYIIWANLIDAKNPILVRLPIKLEQKVMYVLSQTKVQQNINQSY